MDPRVRLALVVAVGGFAAVLDRPASLGLLAILAGLPLLLLPIGWAWRRRAVGAALAVVWVTVWSQGWFYADVPRTPALSLGPVTIWREGITHGLVQSLRLVATTFAGLALAVSTPPDRLFAALLALRVPYGAAFLAVVALRFVPIAGSELWVVRQARARRGRPIWRRSPWHWLRQEMALLGPVVARSLRRARAMAETLDARGFDPLRPRRLRVPLQARPTELALAGLVWGCLFAVVTAELLYRAYLAEVLYLPALRPLYGLVRTWL